MHPLLLGASLGLGAGVSPGPLLALVITTTLERGFGAGMRVAVAPFLTDLPIIVLSVLVLNALPARFLTLVAGLGGLFIVYLGVKTLYDARQAQLLAQTAGPAPQDLWRGALVNILSPHPWLFWLGVGGPLLLDQAHDGFLPNFAFLCGFYALLVGSKVAMAASVAGSRRYLSPRGYRWTLIGGGILLVMLGIGLIIGSIG